MLRKTETCKAHKGFAEYFTRSTAALARLKIYQKDNELIGHIEIVRCLECRKFYLVNHKETQDAKSTQS